MHIQFFFNYVRGQWHNWMSVTITFLIAFIFFGMLINASLNFFSHCFSCIVPPPCKSWPLLSLIMGRFEICWHKGWECAGITLWICCLLSKWGPTFTMCDSAVLISISLLIEKLMKFCRSSMFVLQVEMPFQRDCLVMLTVALWKYAFISLFFHCLWYVEFDYWCCFLTILCNIGKRNFKFVVCSWRVGYGWFWTSTNISIIEISPQSQLCRWSC